ncbi:terminase small subunit [Acidobacteria bacterium AB60]|nr:terminase small subunit [Acidobacteria bacterium AB60]
METLTPKQKVFVREYLVDLNATKAAERAGYSKKAAHVQGARLLSNAKVQAAISEKQEKRFQKLEISAERVLNELALLGFSNMLDYVKIVPDGSARVDLSALTREQAAAIGEITVEEYVERTGGESDDGESDTEKVKRVKFKLHDKRAALVDLGKHLKLFTEKVQVEGEMSFEVRNVRERLSAKLAGRSASSAKP